MLKYSYFHGFLSLSPDNGHVHLAYNPSYSACFSAGTVFFSHKKSANSNFQPAYNSSRTAPTSVGGDGLLDVIWARDDKKLFQRPIRIVHSSSNL
jgi:hypothetical protein